MKADAGVVDEQAAAAEAVPEAATIDAVAETLKAPKKASPAKKAAAEGAVDEQEAAAEAPAKPKKTAAKKKASPDASEGEATSETE